MQFSRQQLIDRDYNPREDPNGPDRADLEKRYGRGEKLIPLDHVASSSRKERTSGIGFGIGVCFTTRW